MEISLLILLIAFNLLFAGLTGWVAIKTGQSFWHWFFLSMPLPVIALCVLLCLPENKRERTVVEPRQHHFTNECVNPILN
jgi:hypothetical protein